MLLQELVRELTLAGTHSLPVVSDFVVELLLMLLRVVAGAVTDVMVVVCDVSNFKGEGVKSFY